SNHDFAFFTNDSSPQMVVKTGTGQVGIGTTLPIARLDVQDFTTGEGIRGRSPPSGSTGVRALGNNTNGVGAWGSAHIGVNGAGDYGVWGSTLGVGGNWAVFASGNTGATGTKSFVIDHPLDPANKTLNHYSTEAPEPLNTYGGVALLDANGSATIDLPEYCEAINKDFRY